MTRWGRAYLAARVLVGHRLARGVAGALAAREPGAALELTQEQWAYLRERYAGSVASFPDVLGLGGLGAMAGIPVVLARPGWERWTGE
jgi:hypothetical protein